MSGVEWGLIVALIALAPIYLYFLAKFVIAGAVRGWKLAQRPEKKDGEESRKA
jgi:hypothetical protein